jgi:hypothetical protein
MSKKNSNDTIGNGTRDLPAFSAVITGNKQKIIESATSTY